MQLAIILDHEINYGLVLCKRFQALYPQIYWVAFTDLKAAYRETHSRRENPCLCIYHTEDFPAWSPPWKNCTSLPLRSCKRLEERYPDVRLPLTETQALAELHPIDAIFRMNLSEIDRAVRKAVQDQALRASGEGLRCGCLHLMFSWGAESALASRLQELLLPNRLRGERCFFVSLAAGASSSSDAEALIAAAQAEDFRAEQIGAFFQSTGSSFFTLRPFQGQVTPNAIHGSSYLRFFQKLRAFIHLNPNRDLVLVRADGLNPALQKLLIADADQIQLLVSSSAMRNPAVQREMTKLRQTLGPGRPIQAFVLRGCGNAPAAPAEGGLSHALWT